jgi:S-adenosylhomocysteine hydrolase
MQSTVVLDVIRSRLTDKLELVESVFEFSDVPNLEDIILIGAQHILPSTLAMLNSFFCRGLSPNKVFLIGKCYSTDYQTYSQLKHLGVNVCSSSLAFEKSVSFDSFYLHNIKSFTDRIFKLSLIKNQKIIVLDDGGELILLLNSLTKREGLHFTGLEQTTSGYQKIKDVGLQMCVINVARSYAKLEFESKIVVKTAVQALQDKVFYNSTLPKNILIFGNGAIGSALASAFKGKAELSLADIDPTKSDMPYEKYLHNISDFDLIVGCVGKMILPINIIKKLNPGTVLASLSSSDREFDIVQLRKSAKEVESCHSDVECSNGVKLLNCGFPINFSGDASKVDIAEFELTRALITLGVLQAIKLSSEKGLFHLENEGQMKITTQFSKKYGAALSNV